jgi:hypothetical protein
MPLTVVSFTSYVSLNAGLTLSQPEWNAFKLIQALKGKKFRGYANIPMSNGYYFRLEQSNANSAVGWFASMAERHIVQRKTPTPVVLVPVPNSSCSVSSETLPRTVTLAQSVSSQVKPSSVVDCLRWHQPISSASSAGGTRDPQYLYDNLVLTAEISAEGTYILIDDMKTTGGHLQACRTRLQDEGVQCDLAICGGRTVWDHNQTPFTVLEEELPDWQPAGRLY